MDLHWTTFAKIAIAAVAVVLFYAVMAVFGLVIDAPIRAAVVGINEAIGPMGLLVLMGATFVGLVLFTHWSMRRDERRQIAATGTIDVEKRDPLLVQGWSSWKVAPLWCLAVVVMFALVAAIVTWQAANPPQP